MKYLFVHQNFPAQFVHLAPALAQDARHQVMALCARNGAPYAWQGVQVVPYTVHASNTPGLQPMLKEVESKVIRANAALLAALKLREAGFVPDVIIAHSGWGESLFLKQVWPQAKLALYCEFFYQLQGYDLGFDPAVYPVPNPVAQAHLQLKNAHYWMHLPQADAAVAPTHFQAHSFPESLRSKMAVIHDGIDTNSIAPCDTVQLDFGSGLTLRQGDEVVTFVNRCLEPYRGFHIFMRALPDMLRRRPHAHFVIVGREAGGYGAPPSDGRTWRQVFTQEIRPHIAAGDWARVRFIPYVPRAQFTQLLQLSTVHIYWTYPFVLSWSLLEAMSAGCCIVGSHTAPVREVISHGETGCLVDFFDPQGMAQAVCTLLDDAPKRRLLGANARAYVQENYDLHSKCLPQMLHWVQSLTDSV